MYKSYKSKSKNLVRIYIQEKNGTLRCVFEGRIHLYDYDMRYSHVPLAVLEEKSGGYYILALPESEIILKCVCICNITFILSRSV